MTLKSVTFACLAIGCLNAQSQPEPLTKNMARWHMGASLILTQNDAFQRIRTPDVANFDESVFLIDNAALTFSIPVGEHHYIIDFGQFTNISRFFMLNETATGSIRLLSSKTLEPVGSKKWRPLTNAVEFGSGVIPSITLADVQTQYLMVHFNIASGGLIGNFGATGAPTVGSTQLALDVTTEHDLSSAPDTAN